MSEEGNETSNSLQNVLKQLRVTMRLWVLMKLVLGFLNCIYYLSKFVWKSAYRMEVSKYVPSTVVKGGDDEVVENYRPILVLPVITMVLKN